MGDNRVKDILRLVCCGKETDVLKCLFLRKFLAVLEFRCEGGFSCAQNELITFSSVNIPTNGRGGTATWNWPRNGSMQERRQVCACDSQGG